MSETTQPDRAPVADWATDWDLHVDDWAPNAIDIWNDLRSDCPVAFTERYGRALMPVTMDAVTQIARDTETFSSAWVTVAAPGNPRGASAPPITSDPPDHQAHRRLLLPWFNPKKIAELEDQLRSFCRGLISDLGGARTADAAEQYSQHIPVHGICALTGVPEEDADMFRDWIHRTLVVGPQDREVAAGVLKEMTVYIDAALRDRLENPRDDMLTFVATAEIEGQELDWLDRCGYVRLLVLAGIDTTWSAIGSGLWHFAQHPHQVAQLVDVDNDDMLWQTAIEEVLRYYAPVTMARKVAADAEVAGCPVHGGDSMLLPFPAANHDPAAFDDPEQFQLDRAKNRHLAFGLGIHRCIGSNLARLELTIALQEWLRAFPGYSLDSTRETTWAAGQIRGPRKLPVLLPRPPVGA